MGGQRASRAGVSGQWGMLGGQVSGNLRPCLSPSKSSVNRQEVSLVFSISPAQLGSEGGASEQGK